MGYTAITALNLKDATGEPLNGYITANGPVNNNGGTVGASSPEGSVLPTKATFLVVDGVITGDDNNPQKPARLVDSTTMTPLNAGYTLEFFDNVRGQLDRPGYTCVQPSGPTFNLDTYVPDNAALTVTTPGPKGDSAYQDYVTVTTAVGGTPLSQPAWIASLRGLTGEATFRSVAASIAAAFPQGTNLLDPQNSSSGVLFNPSAGAAPVGVNDYAAFKVHVLGIAQVVTNITIYNHGGYSYSFVDVNGAGAGGGLSDGDIPAGTPVVIPNGAADMYFFTQWPFPNSISAIDGQVGVFAGTTVPNPIPRFGYEAKGTAAAAVASGLSSVNAATQAALSYTQPGLVRNLLNPAWTHADILDGSGAPFKPGVVPAFNPGNYVSISADVTGLDGKMLVSNMQIYNNGGYGYWYRNAQGVVIGASVSGSDVTAGTPFGPVPLGAIRLEAFGFNDGINNTALFPVSKIGVFPGSTLPNPFIPFFATDVQSRLLTATTNANSAVTAALPFATTANVPTVAWFGDSITAGVGDADPAGLQSLNLPSLVFPQLGILPAAANPAVVNSIANYQFMHAQSGRAMSQAFIDFGGVTAPTVPTTQTAVSGKTLAQELAIVKYVFIFLGTNDKAVDGGAYALGSITDTASASTFAGRCRYVGDTVHTQGPLVRVVWITPYQNNQGYGDFPNNANMVRAIAQSYGDPVISLDQLIGWNALNSNTFLSSDHLHPNYAIGYPRLASVVAAQLHRYAVR